MNFQQLRTVREAVRHEFNLTATAAALFTSQPGVSRQIRELEQEIGVEIFQRYGKRLLGLTAPGETVLEIIERLLHEARHHHAIAPRLARADGVEKAHDHHR
jgi:LysR family cys regulon transcriptional activator